MATVTRRSLQPSPAARPGRPTVKRPVWWYELLLIATSYGMYTLTRNTLPAHVARARANALDLYHVEQWLHLDVERALNDLLAAPGAHLLAVLANYAYSLMHFTVTVGVLVWLYLARPRAYRAARNVLLATTLIGLLGFWLFPLAPPRFFPHLGFVDTVVRDGTWGSWGSAPVASISNQYAAMPSIHVAWSVWSAAAVAVLARPRAVKAAAVLYPVVVVLVIVSTANHWMLDAVGGLFAVTLGAVVSLAVARVRPPAQLAAASATTRPRGTPRAGDGRSSRSDIGRRVGPDGHGRAG